MKKFLSVLLMISIVLGSLSAGFAILPVETYFDADEAIHLGAEVLPPTMSFNTSGMYSKLNAPENQVDFELYIPKDISDVVITVVGTVEYQVVGSGSYITATDPTITIPKSKIDKVKFKWAEIVETKNGEESIDSVERQLQCNFTVYPLNQLQIIVAEGGTTMPEENIIHDYPMATTAAISAEPAEGWLFVEWAGVDVANVDDPTATSTTVELEGYTEIEAIFTPEPDMYYDLLVNHEGEGETYLPEGLNEGILEDTVITLLATPASGYYFDGWTGDLDMMTDDQVTMDGDKVVTAHFVEYPYSLTISVVGDGTTDPVEDVTIYYKTTGSIAISAIDGLEEFTHWAGSGVANVADANAPTTEVLVDGHIEITAHFAKAGAEYYDLLVNHDGEGETYLPEGLNENILEDTVITLLATPASGYYFDGWTGDLDMMTDDQVTMDGDKVVTAHFVEYPYSLTISVVGDGTTDPVEDVTTYYKTTGPIAITAINGSQVFDYWGGPDAANVADVNDPTTEVLVDGHIKITACFVPDGAEYYDLLVNHDGEGETYLPEGLNENILEDTVITLLATPASGYYFDGWTGDLDMMTDDQVTMDGDKVVTAHFVEYPYSLTISVVGDGTTDPAEDVTTYYKTTGPIAIAAINGSQLFDYWGGPDAANVTDVNDSTTEVLVDGHIEITAYFDHEVEMVTLTIDIDGGGEVDSSEGLVTSSRIFTVTPGSTVYMIPDADSGWYFDEWNGPDQSDVYDEGSGEYSIYMDEDKDIEAEFNKRSSPGPIIIRNRLTISIQGNGSVDPFVGSQTYTPGTEVSVTADPGAGWTFEGWFGPDGGDVIDGVIDMDDDKSIIARFVQAPTPPPIEPPEIVIPLTETPLGDGDLPDTGQAFPIESLGFGLMLMMAGTLSRKKDE